MVEAGTRLLIETVQNNYGILRLRDQSRCNEDQRRQYVANGISSDAYVLGIIEDTRERMMADFPDPNHIAHSWFPHFQAVLLKDSEWRDYEEFLNFHKFVHSQ